MTVICPKRSQQEIDLNGFLKAPVNEETQHPSAIELLYIPSNSQHSIKVIGDSDANVRPLRSGISASLAQPISIDSIRPIEGQLSNLL